VVLAGQRLDLVQALGAVLVLAAIVGHELAPLIGRSQGKIELVAPHDRN
jgi:hypothetical protein